MKKCICGCIKTQHSDTYDYGRNSGGCKNTHHDCFYQLFGYKEAKL